MVVGRTKPHPLRPCRAPPKIQTLCEYASTLTVMCAHMCMHIFAGGPDVLRLLLACLLACCPLRPVVLASHA